MKGIDGTDRKEHYGTGRQPWDDILASGWGAPFAAGNVLKYLRRPNKDPLEKLDLSWLDPDTMIVLRTAAKAATHDHSLGSARWYYRRLVEGINLVDRINDRHVIVWGDVLAQLLTQLTPAELQILRGD